MVELFGTPVTPPGFDEINDLSKQTTVPAQHHYWLQACCGPVFSALLTARLTRDNAAMTLSSYKFVTHVQPSPLQQDIWPWRRPVAVTNPTLLPHSPGSRDETDQRRACGMATTSLSEPLSVVRTCVCVTARIHVERLWLVQRSERWVGGGTQLTVGHSCNAMFWETMISELRIKITHGSCRSMWLQLFVPKN